MLERKIIEYTGKPELEDHKIPRYQTHHWDEKELLEKIESYGFNFKIRNLTGTNSNKKSGIYAHSEKLQIIIEYAYGVPHSTHVQANENGVRCTITYDSEVDIDLIQKTIQEHFNEPELNVLRLRELLKEGKNLANEVEKSLRRNSRSKYKKRELFFR